MADLLRELKLPKQRGKDIKEQLECFSNAAFIFDQIVEEKQQSYLFKDMYEDGKQVPRGEVSVKTYSTGNIRFTTGVRYQEITEGNKDTKIGHFKILLSPEFTEFCQAHAVPIDYEVYKDIPSPIGKDIYAWLVFRNNGLNGDVFIPRDKLVDQFMPVDKEKDSNLVNVNYARITELFNEIKSKYYKEVQFDIASDGSGIVLHKSSTPVVKSDPRYALITTDL